MLSHNYHLPSRIALLEVVELVGTSTAQTDELFATLLARPTLMSKVRQLYSPCVPLSLLSRGTEGYGVEGSSAGIHLR